jgi:hypothetical protein
MSTERETVSIVRSWLEDGVTRLPDRVLDTVLDQLPATPQRRPRWAASRPNDMSIYTKVAVAAAAVLVVALAGYQLLPRNGSVGGPTSGPSPTPTLLAQGTFVVKGFNTTLDASGAGSSVSGTMRVVPPGGGVMSVDRQCERTTDGLLWIVGDIREQTADMSARARAPRSFSTRSRRSRPCSSSSSTSRARPAAWRSLMTCWPWARWTAISSRSRER